VPKEEFLEALRAELRPHLGASALKERLLETEAHLNDAIVARRELGMSDAEAEEEAIAAFGVPRLIGRELRRPEASAQGQFLFGSVGIVLFFGCLTGVSLNGFWGMASIIALLALHGAFLAGSFRGRRPQFAPVTALFVATLGFSSLEASRTHASVVREGSALHHRRSEIPELIASRQSAIDAQAKSLVRFRSEYARFLKGETNTSLPGIVLRASDPSFNRFADDALLKRIVVATNDIQRNRQSLADLTEAATRPWWRELPYAPGTVFQEVWPGFVSYAFVHLFAWFVGVVWRTSKQRRARGGTTVV
jgi:hypothetical protein